MESAGLISTITNRSWYLNSKSVFRYSGILFFILSCSFLIYKLLTFNQYNELVVQWKQIPLSQKGWFAGVLLLLPLNWYLEALKWKLLTSRVQKINITTAIKAVLSGISTGFFTPNRVGELVGRIAFLEPVNRKSGVTLSFVNSLTQNIGMAMCGIPAFILFFYYYSVKLEINRTFYLMVLIVGLFIVVVFYFTLPHWSILLTKSRLSGKIKTFTDCLTAYNMKDLSLIMGVSLNRYLVFCTQFYFMLLFFGVELALWQAMIAIPTTYLFVTFTPSQAFSEAVVRSSYAVLIIGVFSGQVVNIALAGVCIWAVNFIIPMLVGAIVLVRKNGLKSIY